MIQFSVFNETSMTTTKQSPGDVLEKMCSYALLKKRPRNRHFPLEILKIFEQLRINASFIMFLMEQLQINASQTSTNFILRKHANLF